MENHNGSEYQDKEYFDKNRNSPNTKDKGTSGPQLFFLILVIVLILFFVSPYGQLIISNKINTFKVRVEVKKTFEADTYWEGNVSGFTISQPIMKCEIISIDRNFYQKNHIVQYEHNVGDIIYITELHGESYSQMDQLDLTIRGEKILGGQYENVTELYAYEISRLDNPDQYPLKTSEQREAEIQNENENAQTTFEFSDEEKGTYLHDLKDMVPADQEEEIQEMLKAKYEETGFKVYVVFSNTNDKEEIENYSADLLSSTNSYGVVYVRNANDSSWHVRWSVPESKLDYFADNYSRIGDAYLINGNYVDRLENVADTAYTLYEESE
jgi:hypothetical protein